MSPRAHIPIGSDVELAEFIDQEGGGGNGGSQTVEIIRLPLAFDTPHLQAETWSINSVDQETKTFAILYTGLSLDVAAFFPPGSTITVAGSTGNDGSYTVVSASELAEIIVSEAIPDGTGDGTISTATPHGIEIGYTPVPGDMFWFSAFSVSEEFDGDNPTVEIGWADDVAALSLFVNAENTTYDSHFSKAFADTLKYAKAGFFTDTTPVRAVLDNGGGIHPGATEGACELIFGYIKVST